MANSTIWWLIAGRPWCSNCCHGHGLPAAAGRGLRRGGAVGACGRRRWPRSWSSRRSSASAPWSPGTRFAASAPPEPPTGANRDVNLDIGETVQVDAWNADGTATVRYRGAQWTVVPRRQHAVDRQHRVAEVIGSRLVVDRRSENPNQEGTNEHMEFAAVPGHPGHRRHLHHQSVKVVPQQNAWVRERLGKYHGTMTPGPELPDPLHRQGGLQAQPEGNPAGRAQPGLHHARQHAAAGRRHPVLPGDRPDARELRLVELHRGRDAAGADLAAQRDRQARTRQDLRGARHHQCAGGRGHRRGGAELGREGAALRDQGPDAAQGDPARDAARRSRPSARSAR